MGDISADACFWAIAASPWVTPLLFFHSVTDKQQHLVVAN
jgi:hypothetical protein